MTYTTPAVIKVPLKDETSATNDILTRVKGTLAGYEVDGNIASVVIKLETTDPRAKQEMKTEAFPAHPMQLQEFLGRDITYVRRERVYNGANFVEYHLISRDGKRLETSAIHEVGDR